MKHQVSKLARVALLLLFFLSIFNIQAQVTVGLDESPVEGALLQLKEIEGVNNGGANSNKGMMLPRVNLLGTTDAKIGDPSDPTDFTSNKEAHAGLFVYNLYDNTDIEKDIDKLLCVGPYVWSGTRWDRLWEPCVIQYAGKIDCVNNISEIIVGTCIELDRLGSFQLTAHGSSVIKITDGDILGVKDGYTITAIKSSAGGDVNYYEVTKDNSPVDINVRITGPNGGSSIPMTITVPIDLSSKITGGPTSAVIDGCPFSTIRVTDNAMITNPNAIIFTSGVDGLSKGFQALADGGANFGSYPTTLASFVNNNYLVRPWGIDGINYTAVSPAPSGSGTIAGDTKFWPFGVRWSPSGQSVQVKDTPPISNQPKYDLIIDGQNLPENDPSPSCNYVGYLTKNPQVDGNSPVWEDFIKVYPIDQAPMFVGGGGSQVFNIDEPYTLSKKISLVHSQGPVANFDIRQIHYGTQILDMSGNVYAQDTPGWIRVYNFDPLQHNNEFQFKIKSNAKWVCKEIKVYARETNGAALADPYYSSITNLDITGADSFGPEEDAYGEPRERTVTVKFKTVPAISAGRYVEIRIMLYNPKLISNASAGRISLTMQLYNKPKP